MRFSLKRRNDRENFPFPEDGAVVYETAPCLIWVPVDGATEYRVAVKNKNGETVMDETVTANYVYPKRSPQRSLPISLRTIKKKKSPSSLILEKLTIW